MSIGGGWILALNGGSSSLKFAIHRAGPPHQRRLSGKIDRIGSDGAVLTVRDTARTVEVPDHAIAGDRVLDLVRADLGAEALQAVGHHVVHGGPDHTAPEPVTPTLLADLRGMSPFDRPRDGTPTSS